MSRTLDDALSKAGIPPPQQEVTAGKFTRWGHSKEYYAIKLPDGSGYFFGNFKEGAGQAVFENGRKCDHKVVERIKKQIEKAQDDSQRQTRQRCEEYWQTMPFATEHEYLTKKKVKSHGLKLYKDKLVVPLEDTYGRIWSFQYIAPDGSKHYKTGGKKSGCFFKFTSLEKAETICICEGYATGATIFECTGLPTVAALDAGNLSAVTEALKKKYPSSKIIICADNDAYGDVNTGLQKASEAARRFTSVVKLPVFKNTETKPTDFNDLFALEGADAVRTQILSQNEPIEDIAAMFNTDGIEPGLDGFVLNENGVSYYDEKRKTHIKICAPLKVIALTKEAESQNAGRIVEFTDRQGKTQQVQILDSWFIKDGAKIHDILYKHGLDINVSIKARNKLNDYLNSSNPDKLITYTLKSGWHKHSFLTATQVFGDDDGTIIHRPAVEPAKLHTSGTLEEWQDNIAAMCVNNSRLMLAVCASFASMILTPCQASNFFFHFFGRSSQGKTTMLNVAASVFGDARYIRTWRATDNALEGIAMAHNDLALFLDEISECDAYKIGAIAYMLVNGTGKSRMTSGATNRPTMHWILGGLSTGEESVLDIIKSMGKNPKAGQLLRILSIPAIPENSEFGLFEDIHGFESSAAFATHLKDASECYHGTAFRAFIKDAIADYENIRGFYQKQLEEVSKKHLPPRPNGQIARAFKNFVICGVAGMLATKYGITKWGDTDIMRAMLVNFYDWLDTRGGWDNQEEIQAIEQIRLFFEKYGDSRFQVLYANGDTDTGRPPYERAGYKACRGQEPVFYVFQSYFDEIIARGLDAKYAKQILKSKGILEASQDEKHFTKMVRVQGRPVRMLVINNKIFDKEDKNV